MWFKVDDKAASHPKMIAAGNTAIGLWTRAGSWSRAQQTNGLIPTSVVPTLGGRPADVRALIKAGLWEAVGGGYQFHDWGEYQPTEDDIRANAARGALGAHRRWHGKTPSSTCPYCHANTNGKGNS